MITLTILVLASDTEAALKAAVARVAPSVVRIETAGGRDTAGAGKQAVRRGNAPTTGLVVSADGHVITSSFNFANKPSDVFVTIPGNPRQVATVVATDNTRMLTLLKVEASGLAVPTAVPSAEVRVGAWAVAVGRALAPDPAGPPAVSVGVVSAVGRVWGKLLQTDAKVSPVNYGGPLVAADGRVLGVLVPASPDADGDTAGAEWYDSGIGFAVPLADVFAALPRLKQGKQLDRGRLGFSLKEPDKPYTADVTVGTVAPGSPLDREGVKPGDVIAAVNGRPTPNFSRLQHALGPLYAGDTVKVTVRRGEDRRELTVTLAGPETRRQVGSLGLLPTRGGEGVTVRWVDPTGPAAKAGLATGDRLLGVGAGEGPTAPLKSWSEFAELVAGVRPGTELTISRRRGDDTASVKLTVGSAGDLPATLAPAEPTGEPFDALPAGLTRRTNPTTGRKTWVFVPDGLRKGTPPGLLVWMHPTGPAGRDTERAAELWKAAAAERGLVVVGPESANPDGWLASEADEVLTDVRAVAAECEADPLRVAAVGVGAGGRMAVFLGLTAGDFVRGAAAISADQFPKSREPTAGRPAWFYLAAGKGERADAAKGMADDLQKLGYPVTRRELPENGGTTLDADTLRQLGVWLDLLDRI